MPVDDPGSETAPEPVAEVVTLIEESGAEKRFLLHDAFDVDGISYYLVEAEDEPETVLLLREQLGSLETVEPDEFDRVMAILESENDQ